MIRIVCVWATLCAFASTPILAQGWKPGKTVEMVIGLTAGSSQDRTGRSLQRIWQDKNLLGVNSIAANRVPTWKEQGVDVVMASWAGVFGVARMSAQQIAWWDRVLAASVATAEWKAFIADNVWEAEYLDGADYTRFLRAEDAKFRAALTDLGLAKQ